MDTSVGNEIDGSTPMDPATHPQNEDSTDRLAEITETWESSPLTEPEAATDRKATSQAEPGRIDDSMSGQELEERRTTSTDY
jgi:hypothetical protein